MKSTATKREALPRELRLLDGAPVGRFRLRLARWAPHRRGGWRCVEFCFAGPGGVSSRPVLWGIFSAGGKGVAPWLECDYAPSVAVRRGRRPGSVRVKGTAIERALFVAVAKALPANGHVMISYEAPWQSETFAATRIGIPLAATRLGALLFGAGFQGGFKDWYFSEGGREGAMKLQANLPLNARHRARVRVQTLAEVGAYLRRPRSAAYPVLDARARRRARAIRAALVRAPRYDSAKPMARSSAWMRS